MAERNGGQTADASRIADSADGTTLRVARWHRYGKDRLYVNAPDGTRVGWVCLQTNQSTVEVEERRSEFDAAVAAYLAPEGPTVMPVTPPIAAAEAAEICEDAQPLKPQAAPDLLQPWTDLATNRPGEGVSAQAKQVFAEAPVRNLAARLFGVHTDERAWRVGAKGEALVGKQLAQLDTAWRVLHSVPVGDRGGDIDHVVIGPGGVYTINTKHHPTKSVYVHRDTFIVGGTRTRYVRLARFEADRSQQLLTEAVGYHVPVVGLIAVINPRDQFTIKEQPRDGRVIVMKRREVAEWLSRRGPILDAERVDSIFEVARRSTTWTTPA